MMNKRPWKMSVGQQSPTPSSAAKPFSAASSSPPIKKYRTQCPANRVEEMYLDSESADVHFSFGSADVSPPSARVPAHKRLLAAESDVFKTMFEGAATKAGGDGDGDISVTDASDEAFKDFLKFFYLSEVEVHPENVSGLMNLGHKYNVVNCVTVCVEHLKDTATAGNILIALGLAIRHSHSELMKFCEQFVVLNTHAMLESCGFLECDHQTLAYIIKQNLLACSDVQVFEACMAWVKAESKQNSLTKEIVDERLGDLFYEIRFGSMTHREFCNLADKYDAVLSNDFKTIVKLITLPNFQPDKFNTRPRRMQLNDWGTKVICNRIFYDGEENDEYDYEGLEKITVNQEEETVFSTNKPLHLIGLACVRGSCEDDDDDDDDEGDDDDKDDDDDEDDEGNDAKSPHDDHGSSTINNDDDPSNWTLSIKLKIVETSNSYRARDAKLLMSTNVKIPSQPTSIPLPWPVLVKPGFYYRISINPYPDSLTYEPKQLKDAVYLPSRATIRFFNDSTAFNELSERDEPVGLISTLEFINTQDN